MNKHLMMSIVAVLGGVLTSCATLPQPTPTQVMEPIPAKSFASEWTRQMDNPLSDPPTAIHLSDAFVFVYRQGGTSEVLDRANGKLLQVDQPKEGAQQMHPPVVLKNRIVYPTTTYLEVYDFAGRYIEHPRRPSDDLSQPFSQKVPYPIRSDAVGSGKLVFFGADFPGSGRAVAVDMTSPYVPESWTLMEPGASVSAAPAISKDVVYVGSENGKVQAVAIETREPLWPLEKGEFGTYGRIVSNLAVDETGLYVASEDTKLYCLLKNSGKVKWQYFAGTILRNPPVLTKDLVYEYVPGTGLVAIDKSEAVTSKNPSYNREPRWTSMEAQQFLSEDANFTYVRDANNQVLALDKKTGERRFSTHRTDLAVFGVNTKGDGLIYVATSGGEVLAVRPVLQSGQVGQIVLAPVPTEPLAMAR